MTSDLSNYRREYLSDGSYSLFQFERSDIIPVLKNSIEYSFEFFKCLFECQVTKGIIVPILKSGTLINTIILAC